MSPKKPNVLRWIFPLALAMSVAIISACGGGGEDASNGIQYTGSTEQSSIDSTNAEPIATNAYQSGQASGALSFGMVAPAEDGSPTRPRALILAQSFQNILGSVGATEVGSASHAVKTDSVIEVGSCGGTSSFTFNVDDQSGSFEGTVTFNNYCDESATLIGSITVSGQMDTTTHSVKQMSMSFASLTVTTATDSFTISGSLTGTPGDVSLVMVMNLLLSDNTTAKVYKLEDVSLTMSTTGDPVTVQMSGKFYHPDYGYVVVATPIPFKFTAGGTWPSEGQMTVEGKPAIPGGGNAMARLTVLSATQYHVEADINGNGVYEYDSGPKNWSAL